eukprot:6087052-Pyramimonas_sp.AAC.1
MLPNGPRARMSKSFERLCARAGVAQSALKCTLGCAERPARRRANLAGRCAREHARSCSAAQTHQPTLITHRNRPRV